MTKNAINRGWVAKGLSLPLQPFVKGLPKAQGVRQGRQFNLFPFLSFFLHVFPIFFKKCFENIYFCKLAAPFVWFSLVFSPSSSEDSSERMYCLTLVNGLGTFHVDWVLHIIHSYLELMLLHLKPPPPKKFQISPVMKREPLLVFLGK